jgi:tetratricopeptide (TPR) repeat protein
MNLINCYRLLGLPSGAKGKDIKASYRRLARRYHPDINQGNQEAQDHFIRLTEAYKFLLKNIPVEKEVPVSHTQTPPENKPPQTVKRPKPQPPEIKVASGSEYEQKLKWNAYEKLQQFLRDGRFARAIALVEGLAYRSPHDPEIRQWQAITYQQWGKQLLVEGQQQKAKIYFKKALRTDPYNRSLSAEIASEIQRI